MEFQLKVERLLAQSRCPYSFAIIKTLLLGLLEASNLEDPQQWSKVARSLLAFFFVVSVMSSMDSREANRTLDATVARGMRRWYDVQKPLLVPPGEREACLNRLMVFIGEEIRQDERLSDLRLARRTADVLLGQSSEQALTNHY